MTRRTLNSAKKLLGDLEQETGNDNNDITVAYSSPEADELEDSEGNPVNPDDVAGQLIVIKRGLVMFREQAEREGRTILGPAEDAAEGAVKVAMDR